MASTTAQEPLLIGLDLGSSAIKGVALSVSGEVLAEAESPMQLLYPKDGFVEFDPETHYLQVCGLLKKLHKKTGSDREIKALSMAAASGNALLLDENSRPLTNIISWLDERAVNEKVDLLDRFEPEQLHRTVGWPKLDMFPLAQLGWLKENSPDVYRRAARFCMNTDFLLYRLTGKWGMDHSTATTFYLQDQVNRRWHKPYLDVLEIDESRISPLSKSGTLLGTLTNRAAADTGFNQDCKVILGSFDHPAAARGTGNLKEGDLMLSCGTSWVGFYPLADRELALRQNLLVDPFLAPGGAWGAMFSIPAVGLKIDKYFNALYPDNNYELLNSEAADAEPGKFRIGLDDEPGIPQNYSRGEIVRAVMESVCFKMRDKINSLKQAGIKAERITMVGGPSRSPVWPQILSDVTALPLRLCAGANAGAVGAALLAGIGSGIFADEAGASNSLKTECRTISPDPKICKIYGDE